MKGGVVRALQYRVAVQQAELGALHNALEFFHCFLHSPKFIGTDSNGARKDWIATSDVLAWISAVRQEATDATTLVQTCQHCGKVIGTKEPCIHEREGKL